MIYEKWAKVSVISDEVLSTLKILEVATRDGEVASSDLYFIINSLKKKVEVMNDYVQDS
jgi:hypothetical protein